MMELVLSLLAPEIFKKKDVDPSAKDVYNF